MSQTISSNNSKKIKYLYNLKYNNIKQEDSEDDFINNPNKYIVNIKITYGIYIIPTINIEFSTKLFINKDIFGYEPQLVVYEKSENKEYINDITCLSKDDNKLSGILIYKDLYYNRGNYELKNSLLESIQELDIRKNIDGLTDLRNDEHKYSIINKTKLEGFKELASISENLWYIDIYDNIKFISIDIDYDSLKSNKDIQDIPSDSIIRSMYDYSKITNTNYSKEDVIYNAESERIGTNIKYGRYNLPFTKIALNTIFKNKNTNRMLDSYYNNILNIYSNTVNMIDIITFTDINNTHKIGDIVVFNYNDEKKYYIIWTISKSISKSISNEEDYIMDTYTCRRLIYDLLPRQSSSSV